MGASPGTASAGDCAHVWVAVETPLDSAFPWYRCRLCGAFGSARRRFKIHGSRAQPRAPKIEPYRCSVEGCVGVAVRRIPGRGPRCSYIWRCEGCDD